MSAAADTLDLSTAGLKAQVDAETAAPDAERTKRVESKPILYTDPDTGELLTAELTSRVLDGPTRKKRRRLAARMAGTIAWDLYPRGQQAMMWVAATAAYQLIDPPPWLLPSVEEDEVLAVRLEAWLADHERRFFRGDVAEGLPGAHVCVVAGFGAPAPAADDRPE